MTSDSAKERLAAIMAAKGRAAATSSPAPARPKISTGISTGPPGEGITPADLEGSGVVSGVAGVSLFTGDAQALLAAHPEAFFDAIITDPGIGAGEWQDRGCPPTSHFAAMLRVVKPGAHMAIFASRRRNHIVATRAEEAGWEIRDTLLWIYPKGMPTAIDIGQAVDRKQGGEGKPYFRTAGSMTDEERARLDKTNPWYGWGTELRPTWEPILLLRRPISENSVADNTIKHGVGALNIDATRIETEERDAIATYIPEGQGDAHGLALTKYQQVVGKTSLGRWPADAVFSHAPGCRGDACVPGCAVASLEQACAGTAKFFYCPKAARGEKDLGLGPKGNTAKAVNPEALVAWITKLILPPGGRLVDPYCGTGSMGLPVVRLDGKARTDGATFTGFDVDPVWLDMAAKRLRVAADSCSK